MTYKSSKFYLDLQDSLDQTNLKKSLLIMLHIRLKEIYSFYNVSYEQLTSEIIELLEKKTLLILLFLHLHTLLPKLKNSILILVILK